MANQEFEQIKEEVKDTVIDEGADTLTADPVPEEETAIQEPGEEIVEPEITPVEKTFNQAQVDELVGKARTKAREKALGELLERYGVGNDDELNELFGKGQAYGVLNEDYANSQAELKRVIGENALLRSGISENKWDDARAILMFKGLEITPENIANELATHPEWLGAAATAANPTTNLITPESAQRMADQADLNKVKPQGPASSIRSLGNERTAGKVASNEEDTINKLFGL